MQTWIVKPLVQAVRYAWQRRSKRQDDLIQTALSTLLIIGGFAIWFVVGLVVVLALLR